jgi:hypothetical protein
VTRPDTLAVLRGSFYDARKRLRLAVEGALDDTVRGIAPGATALEVEVYEGDLGGLRGRLTGVEGSDVDLQVLRDDEEFDRLLDEWATVADPTTTTITVSRANADAAQ